MNMFRSLNPMWIYALSIAFDKGFSFITVPLTAAYVSPGDYGDYEVVLSLTGFVLILLGLGIGDTLIRFASTEDQEGQKRCAAELLGGTLALALVLGTAIQLLATTAADLLDITASMWALRWTLLSSTIGGLVELPLVWFRLRDQAKLFFYFSVFRTIAHVSATWIALIAGYGVEGVIILNAWVGIGFTGFVVVHLFRDVGVAWSAKIMKHIFTYGVPIVGGGIALFAITKLDRWFLVGNVTHEEIGFFGLAHRLSMAATLAVVPVFMWWVPKRIAALGSEEGRRKSEVVWGYCVALIILSALGLALCGPFAIELFFPSSYSGATAYLPGCVLALALGQIVQLVSVGVFARATGYLALAIDCVAAFAALILLFLLVPRWGVYGAIAVQIIAQVIRFVSYYGLGQMVVRLNYQIIRIATIISICIAAVMLAPSEAEPIARLAWSLAAIALVGLLLHAFRIAPIPPELISAVSRRFRTRRRAL